MREYITGIVTSSAFLPLMPQNDIHGSDEAHNVKRREVETHGDELHYAFYKTRQNQESPEKESIYQDGCQWPYPSCCGEAESANVAPFQFLLPKPIHHDTSSVCLVTTIHRGSSYTLFVYPHFSSSKIRIIYPFSTSSSRVLKRSNSRKFRNSSNGTPPCTPYLVNPSFFNSINSSLIARYAVVIDKGG